MPMIVERAGFFISLYIEMAHGAGLTSISFCAVPLKSNNVLRSMVDFVFICFKALNMLAGPIEIKMSTPVCTNKKK